MGADGPCNLSVYLEIVVWIDKALRDFHFHFTVNFLVSRDLKRDFAWLANNVTSSG